MHGHEIRHKYVLQMKLDGQAMLINNNYQHPGVELGLKEWVEKSIYKNTFREFKDEKFLNSFFCNTRSITLIRNQDFQ